MAAIHIKPSHRGLLHKDLGIPADEPVSVGDLMRGKAEAKREGNRKLMKRDTFAENARGWNRKG